jgi:hypothetical protein
MTKLSLALALALLLVPALSLAADPAKDSVFQWCNTRQTCPFAFETTKTGRYIREIRAYNRCSQVPAKFPRIRVRDGKFSKTGTVRNVTGQKLTYTIRGEFKRPKKAVGTYDVDRRRCKAKPRKFTARKLMPGIEA